jgi:hypothetical protein
MLDLPVTPLVEAVEALTGAACERIRPEQLMARALKRQGHDKNLYRRVKFEGQFYDLACSMVMEDDHRIMVLSVYHPDNSRPTSIGATMLAREILKEDFSEIPTDNEGSRSRIFARVFIPRTKPKSK